MEQTMTRPPRSLLEEKAPRIPVHGKIHPGIKVLTRAAASNPRAVEIFNQGLAKGMKYDAIEKQIKETLKLDKSPMTPRNTPFFRVDAGDFHIPDYADRILKLYGEDRGAGHQLYRFPVVFAFDDWLRNLDHGLGVYGASGRKYWSEYDPTGERLCMTYPSAEMNERNARAKRSWGGRQPQVRAENDGKCIPDICREYQARACKLSGRLLFYIPGISGLSLIAMDTTSIYSLQQMRSQMELVGGLRNGRLSGTYLGKALFWVTKTEQVISKLGDNGQPERVKQYLVYLEGDVSMTDIMADSERMLAAPVPRAALPAPVMNLAPGETTIDMPGETEHQRRLRLRSEIAKILAFRKIDAERFGMDIAQQFGTGWSRDIPTLERVLHDLKIAGGESEKDDEPF